MLVRSYTFLLLFVDSVVVVALHDDIVPHLKQAARRISRINKHIGVHNETEVTITIHLFDERPPTQLLLLPIPPNSDGHTQNERETVAEEKKNIKERIECA